MTKKKSRIGFDPLAWMKESRDSIRLGDSLTIAQVRLVHRELKQALAAVGGSAVTLDGSAMEAVDTAGVQLLAAFLREAQTRGITVRWRNVPAALPECARRLGLREALQLA
jgi:anti-anti-sigma regulatory factor